MPKADWQVLERATCIPGYKCKWGPIHGGDPCDPPVGYGPSRVDNKTVTTKPRLTLCPPEVMTLATRAFEHGAAKNYAPWSFATPLPNESPEDFALRYVEAA